MKKINGLALSIITALYLVGCDGGGSKGSNTAATPIIESKLDTNAPTITSASTFSVAENQNSAFTVTATDDSNTTIAYSIISGNDSSAFSINSTSGVVTFNTAPDYETKTSYLVTVKATDSSNNNSTKDVTVSITDVLETFQSGDTFKGFVYNIITSPITGKRWLDRNLGASQACTAPNDTACYGDYYQWGRLADGHEKANSATTSTLSTGITSVGSSFIINSSSPYDWTTVDSTGADRTTQWSKIDGTGVCPVGFRVPMQTELSAEKTTSSADAFTKLKFPVAGGRYYFVDYMYGQGSWGGVWASSVGESGSVGLYFGSANTYWGSSYRAFGFSVRCVEN